MPVETSSTSPAPTTKPSGTGMARRVARSTDIGMFCATGICPPAPVSRAHSIVAPWGSPVSGSKPASTAGTQPTFIRSCDVWAVSRNAPYPTIRPTRQARASCRTENHRSCSTSPPSRCCRVDRLPRSGAAQYLLWFCKRGFGTAPAVAGAVAFRDPRAAARRVGRVGQAARRQRGPPAPRHDAARARHGQGDRGRPGLPGPREDGCQATDQPRHQGPAEGHRRLHPDQAFYKVEHAFARLGRWRRLSRCYEGTPESARAWLEVAALGYLFARLRAEPGLTRRYGLWASTTALMGPRPEGKVRHQT